jgi:hypothetical protein
VTTQQHLDAIAEIALPRIPESQHAAFKAHLRVLRADFLSLQERVRLAARAELERSRAA